MENLKQRIRSSLSRSRLSDAARIGLEQAVDRAETFGELAIIVDVMAHLGGQQMDGIADGLAQVGARVEAARAQAEAAAARAPLEQLIAEQEAVNK